jgi:AcrR family transcriptional regulator
MFLKTRHDTREKIMQTAFKLFGQYGLHGTSVRQIAKLSKVNLAAINYHFKNKENLYWQIIVHTYKDLDNRLNSFYSQAENTTELALFAYDHFLKERNALRNVMKMMLDDRVEAPKSKKLLEILNNPMGPPGGQYFAQKIQQEVSYPLNQEGLLWGVKAIFGVVTHWALMCSSTHFCERQKQDPMLAPKQIRSDLKLMVQAAMQFLNQSEALFLKKE